MSNENLSPELANLRAQFTSIVQSYQEQVRRNPDQQAAILSAAQAQVAELRAIDGAGWEWGLNQENQFVVRAHPSEPMRLADAVEWHGPQLPPTAGFPGAFGGQPGPGVYAGPALNDYTQGGYGTQPGYPGAPRSGQMPDGRGMPGAGVNQYDGGFTPVGPDPSQLDMIARRGKPRKQSRELPPAVEQIVLKAKNVFNENRKTVIIAVGVLFLIAFALLVRNGESGAPSEGATTTLPALQPDPGAATTIAASTPTSAPGAAGWTGPTPEQVQAVIVAMTSGNRDTLAAQVAGAAAGDARVVALAAPFYFGLQAAGLAMAVGPVSVDAQGMPVQEWTLVEAANQSVVAKAVVQWTVTPDGWPVLAAWPSFSFA